MSLKKRIRKGLQGRMGSNKIPHWRKNVRYALKCEPSFGQVVRAENKYIVAGYYMNKEHWNSVHLDGDVSDDILKQMIDMSFELVTKSLNKKIQKELIGGNNSD